MGSGSSDEEEEEEDEEREGYDQWAPRENAKVVFFDPETSACLTRFVFSSGSDLPYFNAFSPSGKHMMIVGANSRNVYRGMFRIFQIFA